MALGGGHVKGAVSSTTFNGELSKHRGCSHTLPPLRLANGDRELRDTLEEALEYREVKNELLPSSLPSCWRQLRTCLFTVRCGVFWEETRLQSESPDRCRGQRGSRRTHTHTKMQSKKGVGVG